MVYGGKREAEGGIKVYFRCCRGKQTAAIADTPAAVTSGAGHQEVATTSDEDIDKSFHERRFGAPTVDNRRVGRFSNAAASTLPTILGAVYSQAEGEGGQLARVYALHLRQLLRLLAYESRHFAEKIHSRHVANSNIRSSRRYEEARQNLILTAAVYRQIYLGRQRDVSWRGGGGGGGGDLRSPCRLQTAVARCV